MRTLAVPRNNPELVQAKLVAFNRQVPLMYALLMSNTLGLSITHYSAAPAMLTLYLPGALEALCLVRLGIWWTHRKMRLTHDEAIRRLQSTIVFAVLLYFVKKRIWASAHESAAG